MGFWIDTACATGNEPVPLCNGRLVFQVRLSIFRSDSSLFPEISIGKTVICHISSERSLVYSSDDVDYSIVKFCMTAGFIV